MSIEAVSGQTEHHESFRAATDIVLRRRVTLWEPFPPKSKILMDLYRYWETLRPTGLLPNRTDFEMDRLRPVMGMASIVDVEAATPADAKLVAQQMTYTPAVGKPEHVQITSATILAEYA